MRSIFENYQRKLKPSKVHASTNRAKRKKKKKKNIARNGSGG